MKNSARINTADPYEAAALVSRTIWLATQAAMQGGQPKFVDTPSEGPFNHGWLTGDETVLSPQVHVLLDEALEIIPGTGPPGHGGHKLKA